MMSAVGVFDVSKVRETFPCTPFGMTLVSSDLPHIFKC